MSILDVVFNYRAAYLKGLTVTLQLCAIAWATGLTFGVLLALFAGRLPRLVGWPMTVLTKTTEAIPIMVMLFWLHYPAQAALGVIIEPFYTTSALLAFLNTLAVFGIMSRAIRHVPTEFIEVARVCGVSADRTFWRITMPLALRASAGSLTTAQINVLQLSIFGSLIAVEELFRVSQRINSQIYQPVQVYTGLALFFLLVCLPLNLVATRLERRFQ